MMRPIHVPCSPGWMGAFGQLGPGVFHESSHRERARKPPTSLPHPTQAASTRSPAPVPCLRLALPATPTCCPSTRLSSDSRERREQAPSSSCAHRCSDGGVTSTTATTGRAAARKSCGLRSRKIRDTCAESSSSSTWGAASCPEGQLRSRPGTTTPILARPRRRPSDPRWRGARAGRQQQVRGSRRAAACHCTVRY